MHRPLRVPLTVALAFVVLVTSLEAVAPDATLARMVRGATVVTATASASRVVLAGAGDIASCDSSGDRQTARLLDSIDGTVFTLGDNAYPNGSASNYANCYDPTWGRHRRRTKPSPGNHDYHTSGAAAYFDYFGWRAGRAGRGYYTYTRGSWRIYSLNSERITDRQLNWLKADLAGHPSHCSLAYWHRPRYSSGFHGDQRDVIAFWHPLYRAGVELVINGHDHDYERFKKRRPSGSYARKGLREIVVGTGGAELRPFTRRKPGMTVVRNASTNGVLKLVLYDDSYRWRFISVDGSFTDTGSASCHGKP